MKKIIALVVVCLLGLNGFSQFPFFTVMPMGVSGTAFADTLLYTSSILKREGIRKITAVENATRQGNGSSLTTTYHVSNGRIEARWWCYRPSPDTGFRFCLYDTLLYNSEGQIQEYRTVDSKGITHLRSTMAFGGQGDMQITWITYPQKALPDTWSYRTFYNAKGQLIRRSDETNMITSANAELFYNADGFLDSIRHETSAWGTYVFTRKKKGRHKEIALETGNAVYRWVYNSAGQCLSSHWSIRRRVGRSNQQRQILYVEVNYSYNEDGTLAKVVEENMDDRRTTTVYTYTR